MLELLWITYVQVVIIAWMVCRVDVPRMIFDRFVPVISEMLDDAEAWFEELL